MSRIATAASSHEVSFATTNSCGSLRWSIAPIVQPSGSRQMLRKCLPSTFMAFCLSVHAQDPPGHRVELLQKLGIARLGRRDQRGVERTVGADRAQLMLAREI